MEGELATGPPRMATLGVTMTTLAFLTSGELALELLSVKAHWQLHPVNFNWLPGHNLLLLVITGILDCFVVPKPNRKRKRPRVDDALLFQDDPWEAGDRGSMDPPTSVEPAGGPGCDGGHEDNYSDSIVEDFDKDDPVALSDVEVGGFGGEEPPKGPEGGCDIDDDPNMDMFSSSGDEGGEDTEALLEALAEPAPPTPPPPKAPPPAPPVEPAPPGPSVFPGALAAPSGGGPDVFHGARELHGRAARGAVAARGSNAVDIHGLDGAILSTVGVFSGYSVRCPGINKDLHFVRSGMHDEEGKRRLYEWAMACVPNHRFSDGRLLRNFARDWLCGSRNLHCGCL